MYSFDAGLRHSRTQPLSGRFTLVEAGSRPVAADVTQGRPVVLDSLGRASRTVPFNPPGTALAVSGGGASPYLMAVSPTEGDLEVTDTATDRSATIVIGDTARTSRYGTAVNSGDEIFVPDYAQGAVVVVNVQDGNLTLMGQVSVNVRSFDLLNYDGSVWYDDPATAEAGVIATDPSGVIEAVEVPKSGGDGQGRVVGRLTPVRFRNLSPVTGTSPTTVTSGSTTTTTKVIPTTVPPTTTTTTTAAPASTTTTTVAGGACPEIHLVSDTSGRRPSGDIPRQHHQRPQGLRMDLRGRRRPDAVDHRGRQPDGHLVRRRQLPGDPGGHCRRPVLLVIADRCRRNRDHDTMSRRSWKHGDAGRMDLVEFKSHHRSPQRLHQGHLRRQRSRWGDGDEPSAK